MVQHIYFKITLDIMEFLYFGKLNFNFYQIKTKGLNYLALRVTKIDVFLLNY